MNTNDPSDKIIKRLIQLYNDGKFKILLEETKNLTKQYPRSFIISNIIGASYKGLGKTAEALKAFKKVTELRPEYPDGHNNMGAVLLELGNLEQALLSFKIALSFNPNYAEVYNNIGRVYQKQNKHEDAIISYNKALTINPNYAEVYNNLAFIFQKQQKNKEALEALRKAILIDPNYFEAYNNIGGILIELDDYQSALSALKKALSIKPNYAEALNNLAFVLFTQDKHKEALSILLNLLTIKPNYADAYNNLGNVFQQLGKLDKALAAFNKVIFLNPKSYEGHNNIGNIFKAQGKIDQSKKAYKKALSLEKNYAVAHRNLSSVTNYKIDNPQIYLIEKLMNCSSLNDQDKCNLFYTYAKMKEDLEDYDFAFKYYVKAGDIRKKTLKYNIKQDEELFLKIKNTAPKIKSFSLNKTFKSSKHVPIFILGMPRSGTTLVEQIISSHSNVTGAGELIFMSNHGSKINIDEQSINLKNILNVRDNYLLDLKEVSGNKPYVTDKMPHNFLYIGLILKAIPEAKIIHVEREPAATCWSNFKHFFRAKEIGYCYDISDTVGYYKLYKNLMNFWNKYFYDKIYHLNYEKLTTNQEFETRNLINYLGLRWEDDCLFPHLNKRSVLTASNQQIRKRVYKGSSNAWLKFKPYLNGIFREL